MKRRDFLKHSAVLTASGVSGAVLSSTATAGPLTPTGGETAEKHITAYIVDAAGDYQIWVRRNNMSLITYRAQVHQKYPYIYPVAGPISGISLTSESSMPWPHHRSLFFGCDRVNGGNYWQGQLKDGQILSQKAKLGKVSEVSAQIIDHCLWKKADADPIIDDSRFFTLQLLDNGNYIIDAEITLAALQDVKVVKTNHGLYGVRVAHDLSVTGGGILINSDGKKGEKETLGKPANWMTFYGKRANTEITEGIAVMIHPKYPDTTKYPSFKDCPWFTRDYGNCSPMPMNFMDNPLSIPKGDSITLKYRTVAYAGTPEDANLNGLWEDFAKE